VAKSAPNTTRAYSNGEVFQKSVRCYFASHSVVISTYCRYKFKIRLTELINSTDTMRHGHINYTNRTNRQQSITIHKAINDSQDTSISISTRLGTGRAGFDSRQGQGFFLFATTALGPKEPPIQWVPGATSLQVKRPERLQTR